AYAGRPPEAAQAAADGLGEHWQTRGFTFKAYPCCGSNHTAVDAYLSILDEAPGLTASQVESIDVECSTLTYDHVGWPYEPASVTAAQMNLRYTLAALVAEGAMSVDLFDAARLADPEVLRLVERIEVRPVEWI